MLLAAVPAAWAVKTPAAPPAAVPVAAAAVAAAHPQAAPVLEGIGPRTWLAAQPLVMLAVPSNTFARVNMRQVVVTLYGTHRSSDMTHESSYGGAACLGKSECGDAAEYYWAPL